MTRGPCRTALGEAAARRRARSVLRDEVPNVAADDGDREEMRQIRKETALTPPPPD
ncbi:MAG: hypothetical protein ACRD0D_00550 [Acidimicrobiales bacterium]